MKEFRLLIAEDEADLRDVLAKYFTKHGFKVFLARDGQDALDIFESEEIDLAILDVMMPKVDGWYVLRHIKKNSTIPVIMLTARTGEEDTLFGFELGADDYVAKPFRIRELVARSKALLQRYGKKAVTNNIESGNIKIDKAARTVLVEGREVPMTAKEFDTLIYFIDNKGIALSRERLLDKVWGYDYYVESRAVDALIKRLRQKLAGEGDRIKTIRGIGYRFD